MSMSNLRVTDHDYLFAADHREGTALGLVSVCGESAKRLSESKFGRAVILMRVGWHGGYATWGHLFGPPDPMPGQAGWLVEVACRGDDPNKGASWAPTGRRWALGTSHATIVSDAPATKVRS